jgi:DNA-binding transcriptional regulator GbsR (MarR family)
VSREGQKEAQAKTAEQSDREELQSNFTAHQQRLKDAETRYDDWHDVAADVNSVLYSA